MNKCIVSICILSIIASFIGCTQRGASFKDRPTGVSMAERACSIIYTYGDASYDKQLEKAILPKKLGAIPADQIPNGFPQKFLEVDGSYGGGRVFCTVEEAEAAILDAENRNFLSKGGAWGIYQVEGDWASNTYELHPNDFRLRETALIIKRVK